MDFSYDAQERALADLAAEVFTERSTAERVAAVEATPELFDRDLWKVLGETGLLAAALPEAAGGAELGLVGAALLLEQQGRRVAHVPLLATLALGALPLAALGTDEQKDRWLAAVAAGEAVLTAALGSVHEGQGPAVAATRAGDGWRLDGTEFLVPSLPYADRVLVPARHDDGSSTVFLLDPALPGVEVETVRTMSRSAHGNLRLAGVRVAETDVIGETGRGGDTAGWMLGRAYVGLAALQLGVCEEALRLTAEYTSQRTQFGRPLSANQAVAVRAADAYLDTEAIRLMTLEAAWRLDRGLDGMPQALSARWWSAEGGKRVVHATQHLHGGIGADVTHPVHRYFLWGRELDVLLGGAHGLLALLGARIAESAESAA
jgi:3-oxocholest-4-en-26-oyl-CoA dehydrogenase beta subunit